MKSHGSPVWSVKLRVLSLYVLVTSWKKSQLVLDGCALENVVFFFSPPLSNSKLFLFSFLLVSPYLCLWKQTLARLFPPVGRSVHWNSLCSSCLKTKVMIVSYLQLNLLLMWSTLSIRRMNKVTDSGHIIQMRIWKLSAYSCSLPHSTEYGDLLVLCACVCARARLCLCVGFK